MRHKARKLTREFVDHCPDGNWPDTVATGLTVQATNDGGGKSWAYEYTSPTEFAVKPAGIKRDDEVVRFDGHDAKGMLLIVVADNIGKEVDAIVIRKGKEKTVKVKIIRQYKRRIMGLGPVRGGLSLVEAREKAVELAKKVRFDGIDPIEEAKTAKLDRAAKAGEAMTVADAVMHFREVDINHRHFSYREGCRTFFARINKGLGPTSIKMLEKHPHLIVDKLDMRERWKNHRVQEEKLLSLLFRAIESVRGRCGITRNPAVVKGCLEHCGLPKRRTKPKGRYKAAPFKDAPHIMAAVQSDVTRTKGGHFRAGARPTSSYLLEFILRSGVRSGEVRQMQYKELNENKRFWLAPIEHMKPSLDGEFSQRPIKLTDGLQAIIDAVKPRRFDQSGDAYVFPSPVPNAKGERGQPYTQARLDQLMKRLWPAMNVHGGRTMIRMWAEVERANGNASALDLIDRQEGRRVKGVGATHYSFDGRPYLEDPTFKLRGELMEKWERHCDQGRQRRKPQSK